MKSETKLIKTKLGLLNLAEHLGNVSVAVVGRLTSNNTEIISYFFWKRNQFQWAKARYKIIDALPCH